VEFCEQKGISHLVYGQFIYGNSRQSSFLEFKRRNGFEQVNFPKYYIPLTTKGRFALRFKLHRGLSGVLPLGLLIFLVTLRSRFFALMGKFLNPKPTHGSDEK